MRRSRGCAVVVGAVVIAICCVPSQATVNFYTDRAAFNQTQPVRNDFDLNASNTVKATQLSGVTLNNDYTFLASTLDYTSAKTALPFNFQLNSLTNFQF